jgi:hypothetical protein
MESMDNRTTYICGICNTKPDQLSHHNAHLNSQTHKEHKIICEYEIRRYVIEFLHLVDEDYWKIYLSDEYLEERMRTLDIPVIEDWIAAKSVNTELKYKLKNPNDIEWWINKYKEETRKSCDLNDKIDKLLFLDWKIKYLIKQSETIQKSSLMRKHKYFNSEIINKINNGELSISELFDKLIEELCFNEGTNCLHIEITGNQNSTLNRHKKCNINEVNLAYLLYANFKDKIICKDVEIETITLGESNKTKRPMWFIKDENSTTDQESKISNTLFKNYIRDLLNTTELDENKKNKLLQLLKLLKPVSSFMVNLRELFKLRL